MPPILDQYRPSLNWVWDTMTLDWVVMTQPLIEGGTVTATISGQPDIDVISEVSSSFDHVSNRDVDTSAEQLTSTSIAAKFGVQVVADRANTGVVYVGNSDVTAGTTDSTDGFPLNAGESVLVKVDNANKVYCRASANNQIVYGLIV